MRFRNPGFVWLAVAAAAFTCWVVYRTAWVCDDAYITFRSVAQVFAGHGPRWNPLERVQAFTHPLWLALLLAGRVFTADLFLAAVVLSLVCTAGVVLAAARALRSNAAALAAFVTLAVSSKAFIDFSTSGLEGPLLFLCLAVLTGLALADDGERSPAPVFVAAGLVWLCRPDAVWLAGPVTAWVAWRRRGQPRELARSLAVGAAAPAAWLAFSLVYYGTWVPNTALAKLNTGVPTRELARFGMAYARNLVVWDPATALTLAAAVVLGLIGRDPVERLVAAGLTLHSAYVVLVGGDFMAGRFFAPAFVPAALVVARRVTAGPAAGVLVAAALVYGLHWPTAPLGFDLATYPRLRSDGPAIADEKSFYPTNFLSVWRQQHDMYAVFPQHPWAYDGNNYGFGADDVQVQGNIGMFGYWAGTEKTIVDGLALSDALLARLPTTTSWRVGHYPRRIPAGYLETLRTGTNRIEDPAVREIYELVRLQTQAPLFAPARWAAIVRLGVGAYPAVRSDYR